MVCPQAVDRRDGLQLWMVAGTTVRADTDSRQRGDTLTRTLGEGLLIPIKIQLVKQSGGLFGMTKQKNWKCFWNVKYEVSPYVWAT